MRSTTLHCLVFITLLPGGLLAREWSDVSGQYTLEADLIAFDDDQVILKRDSDGELGMVMIDRLSEADREFLASTEAEAKNAELHGAKQSWTMASGLEVPGRVVDYARRDVEFSRKRGKVYVNGRVLGNLPDIYQRIAPKIVGFFEQNQVSDEKSLTTWLVHRKGAPQLYTVDGVVLELENGDEYAVPFFMFSEADLEVLKPGWDEWLSSHGKYDTQQDESFELQSLAAAYKQDAQQRRRIAELQLGMQAVEAGVTDLWEVTLYPPMGGYGQPQWVVVPGRDSRTAQQNAMQQYPGYMLGPVRRVSRY